MFTFYLLYLHLRAPMESSAVHELEITLIKGDLNERLSNLLCLFLMDVNSSAMVWPVHRAKHSAVEQ